MNPWKAVKNVVVALQGGGDPRDVAAGFAFGAALGLVPKDNLMAAFLLLLCFFFRVEKGVALVSALIFTPLGYAIDPWAHELGWALLKAPALAPLWTFLYDLPIVPLTRFNNTVVLGNLAIGLVLFFPLYKLALLGVAFYRERWKPHVDRLPLVQAVKSLYVVKLYQQWTEP